ncbi:uncharacterized protein FSUBG_5931 [Fusarium subglutinans]|uniref:Uncharacterized protein n=1 Tax=Gibberella subglutinans TaxID=42677 RepID=A0A8H5Q0U8_GIBSU|nr:uncharacterized protein FSUBG_5931 [Fusarium subglutinans]KAF5606534.1 hypothetical protein FSUBG_5931 [Fusarium subglutinans]
MTVPSITVSYATTTSEPPMTRETTSPIEWDHCYSGAHFSGNRDMKMNGPPVVEIGGLCDVEEEGLDKNFVYGRLSPVPAPRRDSEALSKLNGYLPGYRFVGNGEVEMDEGDVKYESSFHEFTFECPFLPAEDFEGFSGCWREDDYEADVSESCFEESSEESSDAGGSSGDDNVSNAYREVPRRPSHMEDNHRGPRKRKFDDYEQGQIEENELEEDEFDEEESQDVRLEESCTNPSDDEMNLEHVLECRCCSELYFYSTEAPEDHEHSFEDYAFQEDDVEIEESPRRLNTIPEEEEPESRFPNRSADYVPMVTHAGDGFWANEIVFIVQEEEDDEDPDTVEIVFVEQDEESEDETGPYFNDTQLDSAEVNYTFV